MSTMLSIDWDFFPYNGTHDVKRELIALLGTSEERSVKACGFFDWNHCESFSPFLTEMIWHARAMGFYNLGLNMEDICAIDPQFGCVHPSVFIEKLRERFNWDGCDWVVDDSHRYGWDAAEFSYCYSGGKKIDQIVHFDAHHDLGYDDKTVDRFNKDDEHDCATWLYFALREYAKRAIIVYPDWKGKVELDRLKELKHFRKIENSVTFMTWSEWLDCSFKKSGVNMINVARSGAWVPPYLDSQFNDFVRLLGYDGDLLEIRNWDGNKIKKTVELFRAMKAEVKS